MSQIWNYASVAEDLQDHLNRAGIYLASSTQAGPLASRWLAT